MDSVGQRIKSYRLLRGWTQKELASRADMHEVSEQSYELGARHPKPEQLEKLARALDIDISYLYPSKTDTPEAIIGILYDLLDEYGGITVKNVDGHILFGVDDLSANRRLRDVYEEYQKVEAGEKTLEEFKTWLAKYPPVLHNGKREERW